MKNETFTDMLKIGARLFAICAISAIVLALINSFTFPVIEERKVADEKKALGELFPEERFPGVVAGAKEDVSKGAVKAAYTMTTGGSIAGYVLQLDGNGYGGYMKVMVAYLPDGEVVDVKLMDNEETPGLGKKAESSEYMNKFRGKGGAASQYAIPVTKDMLAAQQPSGGSGSSSEVEKDFLTALGEIFFGKSAAGNSDSVTGATITFVGVSEAVKKGSDYIKNLGGTK